MRQTAPHPIPYQGSKRLLAGAILAHAGTGYRTLYEPFAGSAAVTLAASARGLAQRFVIGDALAPLVRLWRAILEAPGPLAAAYERVWRGQAGRADHYETVRERFNRAGAPADLLYLLARCVKSAVRFNARGEFNQSADRRRRGTAPARMRREIEGAHALLGGRARAACGDATELIASATPRDLVYLDPPWQGTSSGKDRRYVAGLSRERLVTEVLEPLVARGVPFLLSYDGTTGDRRYGEALPDHLGLARVALRAGRSAQATLLGRDEETIESLYVWPPREGRRRATAAPTRRATVPPR